MILNPGIIINFESVVDERSEGKIAVQIRKVEVKVKVKVKGKVTREEESKVKVLCSTKNHHTSGTFVIFEAL